MLGWIRALTPLMKTHLEAVKILPIDDAQICDVTAQMALVTGHAINQFLPSLSTIVKKNIYHI